MKQLRFEIRYSADCARIKECLWRWWLINCSLVEASLLWENWSETYCANWLILPKDEEDLKKELADALELVSVVDE